MGAVMDDEGVAMAYLNNLAASTTGANNCRIATGGALVDGKPYYNSANVDVNIPSAVGGGNTRIDRVVLRADWTAQTVRVTRIGGTDAASPTVPSITQVSGTTYDIKLCQCLVNTSGTVTITDERIVARPGTDSIATAAIQNEAVTGPKIATATITAGRMAVDSIQTASIVDNAVDDTKVGNRVPQFYRRQGGDASDWSVVGTTTYTPTTVRMQAGVKSFAAGSTDTITFPVAFSNVPLVFITSLTNLNYYSVPSITTTQAAVKVDAGPGGQYMWLAIGAQ
jgi:hypothetical protein